MALNRTGLTGMQPRIIALLPRLRRFCEGLAGTPYDGDDLMQATVERALTRAHQFDEGTRLDSWMYRIAQNLHIDRARSQKRRGTSVDLEAAEALTGDDGRQITEARSDLAAAQAVLQALPEDQRATFLLVVVEGLSYREAAEAMQVPIGTVMSRIARARQRIAEELAMIRKPARQETAQ
jgi:RNA polymerase sigma-70 factor (ECF subfamily)